MGQITKEFAKSIVEAADNVKHFPLTCHEQKQLAVAWLKLHDTPPSATRRSEEFLWLEQHGGSVGKVRDPGLSAGYCAGDGKGNAGYGDTPEAAIRVLMNRADDGAEK